MENPTYLIQEEAAEHLRLSVRTLERYRVAGIGPKFVKASARGRVLYARAELDGWAAARTFTSTSEVEAAEGTAP